MAPPRAASELRAVPPTVKAAYPERWLRADPFAVRPVFWQFCQYLDGERALIVAIYRTSSGGHELFDGLRRWPMPERVARDYLAAPVLSDPSAGVPPQLRLSRLGIRMLARLRPGDTWEDAWAAAGCPLGAPAPDAPPYVVQHWLILNRPLGTAWLAPATDADPVLRSQWGSPA